jgi:hypothetical protein
MSNGLEKLIDQAPALPRAKRDAQHVGEEVGPLFNPRLRCITYRHDRY